MYSLGSGLAIFLNNNQPPVPTLLIFTISPIWIFKCINLETRINCMIYKCKLIVSCRIPIDIIPIQVNIVTLCWSSNIFISVPFIHTPFAAEIVSSALTKVNLRTFILTFGHVVSTAVNNCYFEICHRFRLVQYLVHNTDPALSLIVYVGILIYP